MKNSGIENIKHTKSFMNRHLQKRPKTSNLKKQNKVRVVGRSKTAQGNARQANLDTQTSKEDSRKVIGSLNITADLSK